ncbi:hypothetical protein [Roseisolibacter agri]|uniref:Lipoprotein n=1 Tax=Roseisolibacter agri TaxID=2014610 RepID=A0AA37QCW2_9BACT|nr:hypothetical protein [Roseisolibacter agri]GLC27992.1 hypothetical protein rosag_45050 [Roseisolibacter agri]
MSIRQAVRAIVVAAPLLLSAACAGDAPTAIRPSGAAQFRRSGGEGEAPLPAPAPVVVPSVAATWSGLLSYPGSTRQESWIVRMDQKEATLDGTVERTVVGLSEGGKYKFVGSITSAGVVTLSIDNGGESNSRSTYRGQLSADGLSIEGTFTSYGVNSLPIPLTLYR